MVEQLLKDAIDKFNARVKEDPELAKELEGVSKVVQVEVEGGDWYHFTLRDGAVDGPHKGEHADPDVRIIASADTLTKLWTKELRVMKAVVTKQLRVKGSMEDLLRLKRFF
ncbi:MAG: SCP2 sterol-binding domain-containing protein [Thermoplasmata archaeon]